MASRKEIIVAVTGSIAAYKACEIVRRLKKAGFSVTVIMTKEAERFITALSLQVLSERKVYTEMFIEPQEYDEVAHISLAKRADCLLIAPATANIIGKIASGIADDLLSATVMSTKAKIVIAPAMNQNMYLNSIVQDNIKKLRQKGFYFIEPVRGRLACGDEGFGCLAPVEAIIREIIKIIKKKRVL
jgi:phosphopantothenoylcysteine decarboxylase/phosphopantothenate--cysteine ligase